VAEVMGADADGGVVAITTKSVEDTSKSPARKLIFPRSEISGIGRMYPKEREKICKLNLLRILKIPVTNVE
jgi:hypothetical protein